MKQRRAKSRASDDQRKALELALSGGADACAKTSSDRNNKKGKSTSGELLQPRPQPWMWAVLIESLS